MKTARFSAAIFAALVLTFALTLGQAAASPSRSLTAAPTPFQFRVEAGQSFRTAVRGYCIDFSKKFPTGSLDLKAGTDPRVSSALAYAFEKGYADNNYKQTGLAMWYLRDNTWHDSVIGESNHNVAQEIVNAAQGSYTDANVGASASLVQATQANQVQARIENFRAIDQQPAGASFYGEGELVVTNTGTTALSLYLPFGTVGPAPSEGFQNMALYAVGQVQQAPATAEALATAAPTATTAMMAPTSSDSAGATNTMPTTGSGGPEIGMILIALSIVLLASGLALRQRHTA